MATASADDSADRVLTPLEIARGIQSIFPDVTVEAVSRYIADDCVVHEAPSLPIGGPWKGPQGFVDLMHAVTTTFPNFRFELTSMCGDEHSVAFSGRISGDTPGGRFDIALIEYWRCRDGKAYDILPTWHDTKHVLDLYNSKSEVSA